MFRHGPAQSSYATIEQRSTMPVHDDISTTSCRLHVFFMRSARRSQRAERFDAPAPPLMTARTANMPVPARMVPMSKPTYGEMVLATPGLSPLRITDAEECAAKSVRDAPLCEARAYARHDNTTEQTDAGAKDSLSAKSAAILPHQPFASHIETANVISIYHAVKRSANHAVHAHHHW